LSRRTAALLSWKKEKIIIIIIIIIIVISLFAQSSYKNSIKTKALESFITNLTSTVVTN